MKRFSFTFSFLWLVSSTLMFLPQSAKAQEDNSYWRITPARPEIDESFLAQNQSTRRTPPGSTAGRRRLPTDGSSKGNAAGGSSAKGQDADELTEDDLELDDEGSSPEGTSPAGIGKSPAGVRNGTQGGQNPPPPGGAAPGGAAPGGAPAGNVAATQENPAGAQPNNAAGAAAAQAAGADDAGAADTRNTTRILPGSPDLRGNRVDILDGEIPVSEFLRFLAGYTQLPIIIDSSQANSGLNQTITIAAPIIDVDDEMVIAILEANRWLVTKKHLSSGTKYLAIDYLAGPQTPGSSPPSTNELINIKYGVPPVLVPTSDQLPSEFDGILQDQIVTMLFELKYRDPADAIDALQKLLGQGGTTGQRGGSRNRAFNVVDIKNSMLLIVTAKFSMLNYVSKLMEIIDVEFEEPERMVYIIEVEEADAGELVSIIETFLQQRDGRGGTRRRSSTGSSTARSSTGARTPGSTSRTSLSRGGTGADDYITSLIPDPRTQKIIVQTYDQSDLDDITMLVKELDTRFDIRRLRTRIYRMKFLKAVDVVPVIQDVLGIGGGGGRSGTQGLGSSRGGRTSSRTGGATPGGNAGRSNRPLTSTGGQGGVSASFITAHEETNSMIIQAEPEDYQEIMNILDKIDVKRRQVFLEAALVQVQAQSTLNYTIELLAGEPDDQATRVLFESSFGLTGIDSENFNRVFPDLSTPPSGAIMAFMTRGKFPAIISALKANTDSEVLATPFILADDNVENEINITETRFFLTTNTVNQATTTNQQGEDAGITLNIVPTISSSNAVLLDIQLEVSEFAAAQTVDVLPPKTTNRITSAVTIADDRIYVVGGLTRKNRSKSVSKVPLLGDIPLLGKLFRSESSSKSTTNLYIFLRAHILTDPNFEDLGRLSQMAEDSLTQQHPDIELSNPAFHDFQASAPQPLPEDRDAATTIKLPDDYRNDPENPRAPRGGMGSGPGASDGRGTPGGSGSRATPPPPPPMPSRENGDPESPFWEGGDLEIDPDGESWFVPIKQKETVKIRNAERRARPAPKVQTGWLTGGNG